MIAKEDGPLRVGDLEREINKLYANQPKYPDSYFSQEQNSFLQDLKSLYKIICQTFLL